MNKNSTENSLQIDEFLGNAETQKVLARHKVSKDSLKDMLERMYRMGNVTAIHTIQIPANLVKVMEVCCDSPEDWTDDDKFIEISNYLEHEAQMPISMRFSLFIQRILGN